MAHVLDEITAQPQDAKWSVRIEGENAAIEITAARLKETSAVIHGPTMLTFWNAVGDIVFQVPRERVLYVRRR